LIFVIGVAAAGKAVRIRHCPATVMRNETDLHATANVLGGKVGGKASA
jgi:hypothetical protein